MVSNADHIYRVREQLREMLLDDHHENAEAVARLLASVEELVRTVEQVREHADASVEQRRIDELDTAIARLAG